MKTIYTHYKRIVTLALLILKFNLGSLYAQNPDLLNYTWYLQSITENGQTTVTHQNPEMTIQTLFDIDLLFSEMCCAGQMELELIFDNILPTFEINNINVSIQNCTDINNNDSRDLYIGFFQNSLSDTFEYSISNVSTQKKMLEITDVNNKTATFVNFKVYDNTDFIYLPNQGVWYLEYMIIGGTFYTPPFPNNDFDYITAMFDENGKFSTDVCKTLEGETLVKPTHFYFMCGDILVNTLVCSNQNNQDFEDLYLNFFIGNLGGDFELAYGIVYDSQLCPDTYQLLIITSPSGDVIQYSECSAVLKTPFFDTNPMSIYPNPTSGDINITSRNDIGLSKVSIFDINGRKVFSEETHITGLVNIQTESLKPGIYLIQIFAEDYSHTSKLIVK